MCNTYQDTTTEGEWGSRRQSTVRAVATSEGLD
jgi:hypothetical protein